MTKVPLLKCCYHKTEYKEERVETLDGMATTLLQLKNKRIYNDLYVQSGPAHNGSPLILGKCSKHLGELCESLSDYEYNLLTYLRKPPKNPLLLLGPPGSGKTTTLHYLFENFIFNEDIEHCCWEGCSKQCLSIWIDFDHKKFRNIFSPTDANERLVQELVSRLNAYLFTPQKNNKTKSPMINDNDKNKFWKWMLEISESEKGKLIPCLRHIFKIAQKLNIDTSTKEGQYKIEKTIKENETIWLDYLLCICQYLCTIKYNPSRPCFYLILDNIDYASAFIQHELVHLLANRTKDLDLNIVVGLRNETFYKNFLGNMTFEYKNHVSAGSIKVIIRRYKKFLQKYTTGKKLLKDYPGLKTEKFSNRVHTHLERVYKHLKTPTTKRSVLVTFIDSALHHFVRSSLLGNQFLIFNRKDFVTSNHQTQHHLLRTFLRYNQDNFSNSYIAPVCNIFNCLVEFENYPLIKLRILSYLSRIPCLEGFKNERNTVLIKHLMLFGYPNVAIENSLQDMASPYHQLIFGLDDDWLCKNTNSVFSRIYITKSGVKYFNDVIYSMDYAGEMIISCAVEKNKYLELAKSEFVIERLHALMKFYRQLIKLEREEHRIFIDSYLESFGKDKKNQAKKAYGDAYGDNLFSYRLLIKCWDQLWRIARLTCKNDKSLIYDFETVLGDYKNAMLEAIKENDGYGIELGVQESPSESDSFDKIIKDLDEFIESGMVKKC